jgi:hypothetical protein
LSQERGNAEIKAISKLVLDNGEEINKAEDILAEQKRFYSNLYTQPTAISQQEINEADNYFFNNNPIATKVTDDDKQDLDAPILENEIAIAVKELPNNKSPGSDGLPINFYKAFWPKIKDLVCNSIWQSIDEHKMSIEQRRGILSLIPKKGKDIRHLKNWRPISLLNSDYKIFAKVIAIRLQKVLQYIISTDQSGCIKGRSAHNNILSTIDIIKHVNNNSKPGILAFIDYEKAFDSISWRFTFQCLQELNFGEYFIDCVKTMYEDISIAVSNSGFLTQFFTPTRGIRQGCPVSANIFIIVAEFLANAIRKNKKIRGITIGGKHYKISQYADDTCLYLQDLESLKNVFIVLNLFTKSSGLKVNKEKSEALGIGTSSNFRHKDIGIKWPKDPIKTLGVYICNDIKEIVNINYKERMDKVKNLVDTWCLRKLSLKGKIIVVNTLLISQLIYAATVLQPPKWVITQFKDIVVEFIWNKKPAKVKYNCIINDIAEGGLKLQDIDAKINACHMAWIKKILNEEYEAPWKTYFSTLVKGMVENIHMMPYFKLPTATILNIKDEFYQNIMLIWSSIHNTEPLTGEDVCRELIWNNLNIKINGKPVMYKRWQQKGINFVQDIINKDGKIL